MSSWSAGRRPITIAILAMGGEGGGVLSNWVADTARAAGWTTQNTSVAGVAQRTGATVYYIELYPMIRSQGDDPLDPPRASRTEVDERARAEPILSTMPTPGEVDVVIASELMEAGRAVQRGFVTPDRTTLIASTNRVYSIAEKSGPADARVDSDELLAGARRAAKRLISADFNTLATEARSVISASLFGALAGSGALEFTREQFEQTIRDTGKGVDASLRAFAAGFELAEAEVRAAEQPQESSSQKVFLTLGSRPKSAAEKQAERDVELRGIAATDPTRLVGDELRTQAERIGRAFPEPARLMLLRGVTRVALYQDSAYADRYLDRVARLEGYETDPDGAARLTTEAARWVALWMCYQDTIQVAWQKVRPARIAGIRDEARAADDQPIAVREYLHPQLEEITDTLPVRLGASLRENEAFAKVVDFFAHKGIVVNTTSVLGFTTLSTLARLRPIRPRSLRFVHEQAEIDAWLDLAVRISRTDYDLACEVLCCARVLKGYGETWERGEQHFAELLAAAESLLGQPDAAARLAAQRDKALEHAG
ncbi:indolepyruvate ferredoxin oxidoreductase beta subunit [Propionibacteriaceae bacterium ES.041]|uniref:Indolepyruvate oxidoreductase n=1 Tax=Enemella evansiae TaxID=2016499 RepID=A0A255GF22_9ACTN|nr:indolepyruvate oxidoreductase subunit beta family protein [Enemella evansiae]OYO12923.1 indolepyruvate oxidoreductase [Enemella evansiae]PFG65531.1 indolepyruvate ferredoxin oxidoreductase beta subunit [Propionibacteriaceae bacterium ES.041]TDO91564.1 indolepyruvate ferredoxin oxidoreductase beta subunit [Enemella evansiae]